MDGAQRSPKPFSATGACKSVLRLTIGLFVLALASGCLEPAADSEAQHRFGGSFTAQATQTDMQDFDRRMKAHGGETTIMESFPPQFSVARFGITACKAARAEAENLSYVATTQACRPISTASEPDQATSTTAG